MTWTFEEKVDYLLRLPWTVVRDTSPEGDTLLRVKELPDVVGCGEDQEALEADFWASLRASLESYLHFGDTIPRPGFAPSRLPWEVKQLKVAEPPGKYVARPSGTFAVVRESTSNSVQAIDPSAALACK